jgi:hypothetical protein
LIHINVGDFLGKHGPRAPIGRAAHSIRSLDLAGEWFGAAPAEDGVDARQPMYSDMPSQPAQMGEHLAANQIAQMRCILDSRQARLEIQIAARVQQAGLNAGSPRR